MLINVFYHWFEPTGCALSYDEAPVMRDDKIVKVISYTVIITAGGHKYYFEGKTPDEVAEEINRQIGAKDGK